MKLRWQPRLTPLVLLVGCLQFGAWGLAWLRTEIAFIDVTRAVLEIGLSLSIMVIGLQLVSRLPGRRHTRIAINGVMVIVYLLLVVTTLTLGHPPDFGVLADHLDLLLYPSTYAVLAGAMQKRVALGALVFLGLVVLGERRFRVLSVGGSHDSTGRALVLAVGYTGLVVCAWLGPVRTHDAPSRLIVSALSYYSLAARGAGTIETEAPKPFLSAYPDARRTHVFFVMLESYNALWLGRETADGREVTPVLNRLRHEGIWVEHFYGNSIHTARGYTASLCSVLPSMLRAIVPHHPGLRLRCLPEILAEAGYATYFFANASDLRRERLGAFLVEAGVRHPRALADGLANPERDADLLWGFDRTLQDDVFFERILSRLDAEHARGAIGLPERPVFVGLSTGSHHMWFDWPPPRERHLFPEPRNREETFASSLHTADRYIESLLRGLQERPWARDSLVVLVGDHGFPAGEHGNFTPAIGAYEENFRTPLVLWSPGWLEPRRISGRAHSQLDLLPTVLDLLGIDSWTHAMGESIVAADPEPAEPELLLQPYDGRQLVSVRYPYKLVRHLDSGIESLHHLARDPDESKNLLREPVAAEHRRVARELRRRLRAFFDNQLRIRLDAFLSPHGPAGPNGQ